MAPSKATANVLDEMDSGISSKAKIWILLVQKLGYPVVVSGVLAGFGYQLYTDIAKPIAATHITTLDTLAEAAKENASSFKALAAAHQDSLVEQRRIGETQTEIKAILTEGLKIQRAQSEHEHKEAIQGLE